MQTVEILQNWTVLALAIAAFIAALVKLLEAWEKLIKWLPKPIIGFIAYGLTILTPYTAIVWRFFYIAGLSPHRLSEPKFFWALSIQLTLGISIYTYIWGVWVYSKLHNILNKPEKPAGSNLDSHKTRHSSRNGGK